MRVKKTFAADMARVANAARVSGWVVSISRIPSVAIDGPNGEDAGYFFQGDEAADLLEQCPDNVSEEDFLLWSAKSW